MKSEKTTDKHTLLAEIDALISYGKSEPTIDPSLLAYLEVSDLLSIKQQLLTKVGTLTTEDRAWLEQFKKYD